MCWGWLLMSNSDALLPSLWIKTSLGCVVEYGKVEKAEPSEIHNDTWVLELEDIEKDNSKIIQRLTFLDRQSKSTKNRFKKDDVLYGKLRPYLNKVVIADSDGVCTTEIIPLSGNEYLYNKYLYYWLKHPSFLSYVTQVGYGVNMPRLGTKDGMTAPFILAPLAEQRQIADKLDELLAQVDSIKTRLDAIPNILKRFRQSVLAAAVSGKLTEDWRIQCGFEIQSNSDPWSKHNFGDLYQLIDGDRGPNYPKQSDYLPNGYCLFLSTKNVRPFGFLFDDLVYISENKHKQLRNGTLQVDDVVITTRGTLGNVAVYDSLIAKRYPLVRINSGMLIIRDKTPGTVLREYLKLFIASPHFADQLTAKQTGSAQPQIPAGILKTFSIGVPKLGEQQEIVRRVEQLFSYADQIEQRVKDAQARVNHLTQAILAKAFRGELTADWRAQNPDLISGENSAEALLAKIQTERSHVNTGKSSQRRRSV